MSDLLDLRELAEEAVMWAAGAAVVGAGAVIRWWHQFAVMRAELTGLRQALAEAGGVEVVLQRLRSAETAVSGLEMNADETTQSIVDLATRVTRVEVRTERREDS